MKQFYAGERVTYVDLFHAVVMRQHGSHVTICYHGKGLMQGEQIITNVSIQWLEHGWNEIKPVCKHEE